MTFLETQFSYGNTANGTAAALRVYAQRLAEEDVVYDFMEVVFLFSLVWILARLI